MRPSSGTNSLHSRITSGVQRSAASAACAAAGFAPPATINPVRSPAAATSSDRECMFESIFTLASLLMELTFQYRAEIGSSSAGNNEMSLQPLSVTTTSSSMRAAE
jgi:hypothetical protein